MKNNISSYLRKNYIINNILNSTEWKHCFINKNDIPRCDLKNKILYLLPFSNKDNEETEKLIYYYSLHENAHAIYTPYVDCQLPTKLCKIINCIEDLRVEYKLCQYYNVKDVFYYGNRYLINKSKEKKLGDFDNILISLMGLSLNIDSGISIDNELIDKIFPIFEEWKNIKEKGRIKSFCEVIKISKKIYKYLKNYLESDKDKCHIMEKIENEDILYNVVYSSFINEHNFSQLIDSTNDKIYIPNINRDEYYKNFKDVNYNILNIYNKIRNDIIKKKTKSYNKDRGFIDYNKLVSIAKNLDKNVFFKQKNINKNDFCFSIILDQSNSMKKYFTNNLQEIIYLCNLLNYINADFQVIGSNTEKPEKLKDNFIRTVPINTYIYKDFDDKFNNVKYRLSNFDIKYHFVDNEVIDSCCKNMIHHNHKNNVVIIFSDGEPKTGQNVDEYMKNILIDKINYWKSNNVKFLCFAFNTENPKNIYQNDFVMLDDNNESNNIKIIEQIKKIFNII